jgi:hypothetical protein
MAVEPVTVKIADIAPELAAAPDLYAAASALDATVPEHLEAALRLSGATAIVSNPPYAKNVNPQLVQACLAMLRSGRVELVALMQKTTHWTDCRPGYDETLREPRLAFVIACAWRTRLFSPKAGEKRSAPKYAHSWAVFLRAKRANPYSYPVFPVLESDAFAVQRRDRVGLEYSPTD